MFHDRPLIFFSKIIKFFTRIVSLTLNLLRLDFDGFWNLGLLGFFGENRPFAFKKKNSSSFPWKSTRFNRIPPQAKISAKGSEKDQF